MPPASVEEVTSRLLGYWSALGCSLQPAYDRPIADVCQAPASYLPLRAGTAARTVCIQTLRRPMRSRYGKNSLVRSRELFVQVLMRPAEADVDDLLLKSLKAAGFELDLRDVRLLAESFEASGVGVEGAGWRCTLDGIPAARVLFFQRAGGEPVRTSTVEIAYAVERLALVQATVPGSETAVGARFAIEGHRELEEELSREALEVAVIEDLERSFDLAIAEASRCLTAGLHRAAYERVLEALHGIERLDARGALTASSRSSRERLCRRLAVGCLDPPAPAATETVPNE